MAGYPELSALTKAGEGLKRTKNLRENTIMSIALAKQLNFEKQMPIDGNCKQQMTVAVPCTGAGIYNPGTYFMINLPRCGPDYV